VGLPMVSDGGIACNGDHSGQRAAPSYGSGRDALSSRPQLSQLSQLSQESQGLPGRKADRFLARCLPCAYPKKEGASRYGLTPCFNWWSQAGSNRRPLQCQL
jgi:hypothetical protein